MGRKPVTYLQPHHLDLAFYDTLFAPYLRTHADHLRDWHPR